MARVAHAVLTPVVAIYRSGIAIQQLEGQLAREEQRRQRLLADRKYLTTPAGVEQEARRQGWVRRGETAIQIVRPEGASARLLDDAPPPAAPPRPPTIAGRVSDFVAACLASMRGGAAPASRRAQSTK
jgi:hypothetical protein